MPYGFNKRETAKKLSRIASDDNIEYLTRRRPDRQPALLRGNLRFFYATPDGDIPAGTPLEPRRGMAFILRLNTDSEMMEKGQADGVDIDSVEVWNRGPAIMAGAANSLEPVISLQGDSHGNLWIQSSPPPLVHAHVRVPDPLSGEEAGIAGGATVMCEVISYSDGRDIVAGENDMLPVTNWKTERRGETNNHELKVEPWGDGWEIYDEDFICPDDSGGP